MGVYMYQAALYCRECGEKLVEALVMEGKLPSGHTITVDDGRITIDLDETLYDSDDFPKYVGEAGDSDSPNHCEAGETCINALDLAAYHGILAGKTIPGTNRPVLVGAETRKIGAWLENGLTSDGEKAVIEMVTRPNPTPYQVALHAFWKEVYDGLDYPSEDDDDGDE